MTSSVVSELLMAWVFYMKIIHILSVNFIMDRMAVLNLKYV